MRESSVKKSDEIDSGYLEWERPEWPVGKFYSSVKPNTNNHFFVVTIKGVKLEDFSIVIRIIGNKS